MLSAVVFARASVLLNPLHHDAERITLVKTGDDAVVLDLRRNERLWSKL
jgi:hypothetical protein